MSLLIKIEIINIFFILVTILFKNVLTFAINPIIAFKKSISLVKHNRQCTTKGLNKHGCDSIHSAFGTESREQHML